MIADCGIRFKHYKRQFYRYISGARSGEFTYAALPEESRDRHYLPYVRNEERLPWVEPDWSADAETGEVYKAASMVYGEEDEAADTSKSDCWSPNSSERDITGASQGVNSEA